MYPFSLNGFRILHRELEKVDLFLQGGCSRSQIVIFLTYYEIINVLNFPAAVTRVIEPRVEEDVDGDPHAKGALQTLPEMPLKHV